MTDSEMTEPRPSESRGNGEGELRGRVRPQGSASTPLFYDIVYSTRDLNNSFVFLFIDYQVSTDEFSLSTIPF